MFTQADVGAAVVGELVGGVAGDVLAVDDYLASELVSMPPRMLSTVDLPALDAPS